MYIDIIFLFNVIGDYLCLSVIGSILRKTTIPKKIFASFTGGIYGVLCCFDSFAFLSCRTAVFIAAAIITAIAYFPFRPREFLSLYTMYLISSMLLCGGTELLVTGSGHLSFLLCMTGIAGILFYMLSSLRGHIFARHMACRLVYKGYSAELTGFYDSGNRLFSSGGDRRVIIADESVLKLMFCKNANAGNISEWVDNISEVRFCSAAGGVMRGFMLDYAVVDSKVYNDVFLAISNNNLKDSLVLHSTMI